MARKGGMPAGRQKAQGWKKKKKGPRVPKSCRHTAEADGEEVNEGKEKL